MATHWMDNGPEGWHVPLLVEVPEECMADAGDTAEGATAWMCTLQGIPDRVRLPAELGGDDLYVINSGTLNEGMVSCANCGDTSAKPMLELELDYGVAQCTCCRFYNWFKKEQKP